LVISKRRGKFKVAVLEFVKFFWELYLRKESMVIAATVSLHGAMVSLCLTMVSPCCAMVTSVSDPKHFHMDPDPDPLLYRCQLQKP
jgi:hypothetical protein